jgi:adenosylcobinamide kinase/adenosylcobinamide-phosphate guanylyltransferase
MNSDQLASRQIILVTGAARCGKSEWAENLAIEMEKPVIYLATAQEDTRDWEWQTRLEQHRRRRPRHWQTLEVPVALAETIEGIFPPHCLLIDSLGTWVANLLELNGQAWQQTSTKLLTSLTQAAVDIILVAEETGWGVVPAYPTGRQFRDRLGMLIRQIGAISDTVYLVTGGYALNITLLGQKIN